MPRPRNGYALKDGTKVPGVTDITNRYMDKEGLIIWAFRRGRQGARWLNGNRDKEIGATVDAMVDLQLRECPTSEIRSRLEQLGDSAAIAKAQAAFRQWERWRIKYSCELEVYEVSLVSEQHRYGGTLDHLVRVQGRRAILERKASPAIYPNYLVQTAAYKPLWQENNIRLPINGGFHLLALPKDGSEFKHHYYQDLDDAWQLFRLYRQAYDIDRRLKTRQVLRGDPAPIDRHAAESVGVYEFLRRTNAGGFRECPI